jgi:acetolactate synthase-1/3 small subunit
MFNIQSLSVAPTINPDISCMTIDVDEEPDRLRRMQVELSKIVNVLSVDICDKNNYVETEMVLVKINTSSPHFSNFLKEVQRFNARVVYRQADIEIVEFSGDRESIKAFLDTSLAHEVESVIRTGPVAMCKKTQDNRRAGGNLYMG